MSHDDRSSSSYVVRVPDTGSQGGRGGGVFAREEDARHAPPMVPFGGADEGPLGERQETWMDRAVRSPREEFRCKEVRGSLLVGELARAVQ